MDIALTLRADTTRVAVSTTGVISPTKEIGCYNHVVVFQYSADLSRWVYITPPGPSKVLTAAQFTAENLHRQTEFKVYSMTVVGPRARGEKTTEANKKVMQKAEADKGGKCTDATPHLRLPKSPITDDPFEKLELLTTSSAPDQRTAFHKRNLRFLDKWLGLHRTYPVL